MDSYSIPRDLLVVVEQLVRSAMGSEDVLNVTGLNLPPTIRRDQIGETKWAKKSEVATWTRDRLRELERS